MQSCTSTCSLSRTVQKYMQCTPIYAILLRINHALNRSCFYSGASLILYTTKLMDRELESIRLHKQVSSAMMCTITVSYKKAKHHHIMETKSNCSYCPKKIIIIIIFKKNLAKAILKTMYTFILRRNNSDRTGNK